MAPPLTGTACALHPNAAAVDVCARCGRFVCADCAQVGPDEETVFCTECGARQSAAGPSKAATRALATAALAFAGPFVVAVLVALVSARLGPERVVLLLLAAGAWLTSLVVGVFALVSSLGELRRIAHGAASHAGRLRARLALVLATCALLMGVLLLVASLVMPSRR